MSTRKPTIIALAAACIVAVPLTAARSQERDSSSALASAGQISGSVLDTDRNPVRGTSVAAVSEDGAEIYGSSTNQRGRYAIRGLKHGTYSVLVMDPTGLLLRKEQVNVKPLFRNLVDFVTEPAGSPTAVPARSERFDPDEGAAAVSLTGTFTELDGNPIPEAWLTVTPDGGKEPALRARSDGAGKFKLLEVKPGRYRIRARALGHITWSLGPVRLPEGLPASLSLALVPFPLGHPESLENLLVPVEPATPESFIRERPGNGSAQGEDDPGASDS